MPLRRVLYVYILLVNYTRATPPDTVKDVTSGWALVMKIAHGQDIGEATTVYNLWTGIYTVNEGVEDAMSLAPGTKTYRSSTVESWSYYNISAVRVSFIANGEENAYAIFDARGSDKNNWFNKSRVLYSSWDDLNPQSTTSSDSIKGYRKRRRFYMNQRLAGCNNDEGWFGVCETEVNGCDWEKRITKPFFLYSNASGYEKSKNQELADVFAIWVFYDGFSTWSSFGTCSTTCGSGNMTRTRTCYKLLPVQNGSDCSGTASETVSCNDQPCPIDGGWSPWSGWGSCTTACGEGTQQKTRTCTNPPMQHGGADCPNNPSASSATQACNTTICQASTSCPHCVCQSHVTNMTSYELLTVIAALKEELKVDKTKTSMNMRRKTSAEDSRTSAKTMGIVGGVLLAVPVVLVNLSDLTSLYQKLKTGRTSPLV